MAGPIATAAVQIVPTFKGLHKATKTALAGTERDFQAQGSKSGSLLVAGFKGLAVTGGIAAGAAVASGFGIALSKGFGRLTAIENAQKKLEGLGHDAKTVTEIMTNATAAVKGTAFGLDEAATVSAALVASGIKPGQELEKTLKTVADSATIAGIGMDEMGAIFGKVASGGKLQGDELNQLAERGIPALQLLSTHLGVTTEEVRKMVSKGEVDFKTFADAMDAGMGGAALKSGETFQGAWKNTMAALGRIGAKILEPIFLALKDGMNTIMPKLDAFGAAIEPLAAKFGELLAAAMPVVQGVFNALADALISTVTWIGQNLGLLKALAIAVGVVAAAIALWNLGLAIHKGLALIDLVLKSQWLTLTGLQVAGLNLVAIAQSAVNKAMASNPIGLIIIALVALVAGLVLAYKKIGWFRDIVDAVWAGIKTAIGAVATWLTDTVWPAMQTVWNALAAGAMWLWQNAILPAWNGIQAAVAAVQAWWTGTVVPAFQATMSVLGAIFSWLYTNVILPVFNGIRLYISVWWAVLQAIFTGIVWVIQNVLAPVFNFLKAVVMLAFDLIRVAIQIAWGTIQIIFNAVIGFVRTVLAPVFTWLYNAVIMPVFNGIKWLISMWWNGVKVIFNAAVGFVRTVLAPAFSWFYNNVIMPVFNGIKWLISMWWNGVKVIFNAVISFVRGPLTSGFQWLRDRVTDVWNGIKSIIRSTWDFIRTKVFDPLANAIRNTVPDAFRAGKDAIGKAWDGIKEAAKAPVKFVIDTVINNGVIEKFNDIAKHFGVKKIDRVKLPKGFARGGWTGPGPRLMPAGIVHADEFVLRKQARRRLEAAAPGALDHMNRTGEFPMFGGYAGGGMVWNNLWGIVKEQFPRVKLHSAYRPGAVTASGNRSYHSQGKAVDITPDMKIFNWLHDNYGQSSELIYSPAGGRQIKNGRHHYYTGRVRDMHFNHIHWANRSAFGGPTAGAGGGDAGGGGMPDWMGWLKPFEGIKDKITKGIAGKGAWMDVMRGAATKLVDMPIEWIKDKASTIWDGAQNAAAQVGDWMKKLGKGKGMEKWRPLVAEALKITGIGGGKDDEDRWLRQIKTESNGNPNLIQSSKLRDINVRRGDPARGLVQVPGVTWADFGKDMGPFMQNWMDPLKNLIVGMRAASKQHRRKKYHGMSGWRSVVGWGHGYADGGRVLPPTVYDSGRGVLPPGLTTVLNGTRQPEVILSREELKAFAGITGAPARPGVVIEGDLVTADPSDAVRELRRYDATAAVLYPASGV